MPRPRFVIAVALLAGLAMTACSAPGDTGQRSTAQTPKTTTTTTSAATGTSTKPTGRPAARIVAASKPKPNACAHNAGGKLVLVDVSQQHMWLCQGTHATFSSAVTTGAVDLPYESTPTGHFEIQQKDRNRTLTLINGKQFTVKYWIPFQGPLFGFHDASWQTMPYGSQQYRTKGSHGCVHLPLLTIRHLYHWADIGTPVRIRR